MSDTQLLDLDALLAACDVLDKRHWDFKGGSLKLIVDSMRPLIERCKWAELKTKGTLANNLCPDHRDKQAGKPCLVCTIETLTNQRDKLVAACERLSTQAKMVEEGTLEGTLCSAIRQADNAIANVKGGTDGT
jgi:hypothetical protein